MRIDQAEGTDYLFFEGGAYRGSMSILERNVVHPDVLGKYKLQWHPPKALTFYMRHWRVMLELYFLQVAQSQFLLKLLQWDTTMLMT